MDLDDPAPDRPAPTGTTTLLWTSDEQASAERCASGPAEDGGWRLAGDVLVPVDGDPAHVTYAVAVDAGWRTRSATVVVDRAAAGRRTIALAAAPGEPTRWTVDGAPAPDLDGCVDVDLGFTPATNTLPVRRVPLAVGESRTFRMAWLLFPELVVRADEQTYTRLAGDRWEYRSGDFVAELALDAGGHVLRYGDDLWVARARVTA